MTHSLEAVSLDKLQDFLVCSICLEIVTKPRTLPCFHSYCQHCLETFVEKHRGRGRIGRPVTQFNCPTCRRPFTLNPEDKVAEMSPNHFVLSMLEVMAVDQHRVKGVPCSHCENSSVGRCVDCNVFLCQSCLTSHNAYPGFKGHSVLSMDELSKPENQAKMRGKLYCKGHENKKLKFYCETCDELICRDCTADDHEKPDHSWSLIGKVVQKEKQALVASCSVLEGNLTEGKKAVRKILGAKESLEQAKDKAKQRVIRRKDEILEEVTQKLNKKVEDLLAEYDKLYIAERDNLVEQEKKAKGFVEELESYVNLSQGLLDKGTDEEIVSAAKSVKENVEKLQEKRFKEGMPTVGQFNYTCDAIDGSKISACVEQLGVIWKEPSISENIALIDLSGASTGLYPLELFSDNNDQSRIDRLLRKRIKDNVYGVLTGDQPPGKMTHTTQAFRLPGYKKCGTISISYDIPSGTQGPNHPNPGQPYCGTRRSAYLPDNQEGQKVLKLFKKAFDQGLTFTIGRSSTTGAENGVIWNDIHHKTSTAGGPTGYGYPDPDYLRRVQEELAAKGITE